MKVQGQTLQTFKIKPDELKLLLEMRRMERIANGRSFDALLHVDKGRLKIYRVERPLIIDRQNGVL